MFPMNNENPIKPVAIHRPLMGNLIRQKRNTMFDSILIVIPFP